MTPHGLILSAAMALAVPGAAQACQYLTSHFELCDEGTPWANGTWEQGGDSATLHLDGVKYDSFEEYLGRDDAQLPEANLTYLMTHWAEDAKVVNHLYDSLPHPDMPVLRTINTITFPNDPPQLRVTMIANAKGERILMMLRAPGDLSVDQIDTLSRDYAALVRPRQEN
jgi:hypothetical protein